LFWQIVQCFHRIETIAGPLNPKNCLLSLNFIQEKKETTEDSKQKNRHLMKQAIA
jgi:hypothetical protein